MSAPTWLVWIGAWGATATLMAVLWEVQRRRKNAGIVDVAWAFGTALVGIAFCVFGTGAVGRRALLGTLIGVWGLRLGTHLWRRVASEKEDGRYRELRKTWGETQQKWLFVFFQIQASWALIFASSIFFAARNDRTLPALYDFLGVGIWLIAIAGETVADRQLSRFRSNPENRGKVCRQGLWAWSRHPNYFFEWVHWFGYVAIGWAAPWGFLTLIGPMVMLLFLLKITGIPPTESQALRSRGESYRRYQNEVSVFIPLPPRRAR